MLQDLIQKENKKEMSDVMRQENLLSSLWSLWLYDNRTHHVHVLMCLQALIQL